MTETLLQEPMTETYSIDHTDQLAVSQTPELPLEGFEARHIGLTAGTENSDHQRMLEALGYSSMESFITDVVPDSIYQQGGLNLPDALSEAEALSTLKAIAKKNLPFRSMIGQGYYATETPTVILRNILESPAWYTAYTPYQPEISQGRLEALLNFQTMVCDLTGMDISNASMLDEGSAAAEAMSLAKRSAKNKSNTFFVDQDCLPQTIEVVKTRAHAAGYELYIGDPKTEANSADYFGLLLQYPGCSGEVTNFEQVIENAHAHKSLVIMAADIMSLVILKSPGQLGADVVVGNSQRFGVPVGFGGPHAAFMATKERFQRSLPGRLVGVSIDSDGKPAYRLALQTREQHIRREKATSNICTAQVLLAVIASMYACYHGPAGLRKIACRIHRLTTIAASGINQQGFAVENQYFFDTLTINTGAQTQLIYQRALAAKINLRRISDTQLGFSVDQASTEQEIELIWRLFAPTMQHSFAGIAETAAIDYSAAQYRDDAILTHPVFSKYQSETEMLRYIRRLSDKDLALDRTMIPLGSCTMKLNASSEMIPVTWPEFGSPHPFAPAEQVQGYQQMIAELEQMLAECTGYDVVSLQPNAGSQGEFAGLLAIAAYHKSRGDEQRNICLIPSSAHGTNPASAQMCNMKVVVVNCDSDGNVDLEDLQQKAEQHSKQLAALMVTYPSTHGVFEEQIKTVTALIHQHGGQVYVDGANLNAMVGLCGPGDFGGDVSHLNLHKTFCIPHGGGGPGVGPVAAKAHLAPYLPAIASAKDSSADASRPQVSSAPYGSASILPISWMYMRMMGASGLRRATEAAILSANFIAYRLADAYPVLYTGNKGLVAHECIIDLRGIKESTGIAVEDVSKRLIDYGFHAPTMSFPVAGTLMIEPTESEARCELDRFCDAMLAIKAEIMQVADGQWPLDDNPLVNAPHTAEQLIADQWVHSYSRSEAAYPIASLRKDKYFSPVARIDNVFGDRNLICSCPSMEDFL
tara:strand:- start:8623 stop:11568 length:2946 start_codon:yes stop_codon:yes gene_type:complete